MECRIEQMGPMQLLGKVEWQDVGNVQASRFWDRLRADGAFEQLTQYSTSPSREYIGLADAASFDGKGYNYYIATPYTGEVAPEGFVTKTLPASTWIKFRLISLGAENTADELIWQKIYSEYFPTSDYEPAEYQLEVYPQGDGSYPDDIAEVWIAARLKA